MESNAFVPQFGARYDMGVYLVTSGILSNAWKASDDAYHSDQQPFIDEGLEGENLVFIAFPGSSKIEDFITDSKFAECEINKKEPHFSSLKYISNDSLMTEKPPLVHAGFLERFFDVLQNSNIDDKISLAQKEKKTIVFTGHSLGGAIGTFATLWVLEKRKYRDNPPLCVTFGCPLVGDEKLAQIIRREGWVGQFCHVVSRHDIVPRILLAPLQLKSISQPLKALLPYWGKSMQKRGRPTNDIDQKPPLSAKQTCDFYSDVKKCLLTVTSYTKAACTMTANLILGGINNVVKQSPYRPFGYFVFCSSTGAACIENHATVLQMLYHTLHMPDASPDLTADACISEHTAYRERIDQIAEDLLNGGDIARVMRSDAKSPYEVGIALQLEALGIGVKNVQARLALQAGGEAESRRSSNSVKMAAELGDAQAAMAVIEWYKKSCTEDGFGYYDSFKRHNQPKDIQANLARLKLAAFWDRVMEMVERQELPDDFESQNKWINAGTAYRRLVEPLDIANYYRLGKFEDTGRHYVDAGRPRRYRILEKWLERKARSRSGRIVPPTRRRPAQMTSDSCFWGHLEKVLQVETLEPTSDTVNDFKRLVLKLDEKKEISEDVVLESSTFTAWRKTHPEIQLSSFMERREERGPQWIPDKAKQLV